MKVKNTSTTLQLSKKKRIVFSVVLALLPILFLLILEVVLRIAGYGNNFSLFINHPDDIYKEYKVVNPEIGKKYFQKFEYSVPAKDIFLKEKPDDVFRIFVMGSSSVAGFPYDNNLMFSRILNERLRDVYPGKKIEVVNTAITAINSFTLLDFMPQILNEKPDAILIYAGHNEFYGAFGAGSNEAFTNNSALIALHLKMMNLRFYQLTKNSISQFIDVFRKNDTAKEKRGTLMSRIVKNADIIFGDKVYKRGIENYEKNMGLILSLAQKQKVKVFISDMVSNLRDTKPFKSVSTVDLKGAQEYYEQAQEFEQQQNFEKAKENYIKARDFDCIRFRASSDINTTIKKLAEKYSAHFVPSYNLFNSNSQNGIVGDNLLTEHVHPNILGAFLLADSFYKELIKSKKIDEVATIQNEKTLKYFAKNYGYTSLDYFIGKHRITNLKYHWPFTDETSNYVDYREIYKPEGLVDSLAFTIMATQKITVTDAHIQLAEIYEEKGDLLNAFKEYNSLTKINPYVSTYFRKAADCLLKMNDLPEALRYFERSTEYIDDSFYARFRSGEICMIKNDFESALMHFDLALKIANAEEKSRLYVKMYQSLNYLNRIDDAKKILADFQKQNPNQTITVPPKTNVYMRYIPLQVQKNIEEAIDLISRNKTEEAIETLYKALEIRESPIVFRMLGELFYKTGRSDKSQLLLMKVYPEFKFDMQFIHYYIVVNLSAKNVKEANVAMEQLKKIEPNYPEMEKLQGYIDNFHQ